MDSPLVSAVPTGRHIADILFIGMTSFKTSIMLLLSLFFLKQLISWANPLMILGTIGIFVVLKIFQVSPPPTETVNALFGSEIRPVNKSDDFSEENKSSIQDPEKCLTIIGHRGAGLDAPENSISAFRQCKSRGCPSVEFDVDLCKDNVAVVFHDDNALRMTGVDRNISDMTLEELKKLDISISHPLGEKFKGERIPTFEETITTCLSLGLKFFIDVKFNSDDKIVEVILDAFKKYPDMYKSAAISSFSPKKIYLIRSQDPSIIGCYAWRPHFHRYKIWNSDWENVVQRNNSLLLSWRDMLWDMWDNFALNHFYWWFLGLSSYMIHKDCLTKETSYRWSKKGVRVFLATLDTPLEKLHCINVMQLGYYTDTLETGL